MVVEDSILAETGLRMKGMLRGEDAVARWGGEEFVVLLPDTDLKGGQIVAEKIRGRIADAPYYFSGKDMWITASFGLAEYRGQLDIDHLLKEADRAFVRAFFQPPADPDA